MGLLLGLGAFVFASGAGLGLMNYFSDLGAARRRDAEAKCYEAWTETQKAGAEGGTASASSKADDSGVTGEVQQ
jgi:hypothetical protein